jgi:hypothetical protein
MPKITTLLRDLAEAGYQKRHVQTIADRRGTTFERVDKLRREYYRELARRRATA